MTKKLFIIVTTIVSVIIISGCTTNEVVVKNNNTAQEPDAAATNEDDGQLTPEQVLARMNEEEGVGVEQGPVKVSIVSPEEEVFQQSQARFYSAEVSNLVNGSSCYCDWKFYLNEYDEETLYQQMNDRQCTSTDTEGTMECGFTSTFINSKGDLRVVVDVEVEKGGEIVQAESAEANYRVE